MNVLRQMSDMCAFHNAQTDVWPPGKRMGRHSNVPGVRLIFYQTLSGHAIFRRRRGRRIAESRVGPGMAFMAFSDGELDWRAAGDQEWRFNFINIALKGQESLAREFVERFGDVFDLAPDSPLALLLGECVALSHNQKRKISIYEASEMAYRFLMCLFHQFSGARAGDDDEGVPILVRQVEQFLQGEMGKRLGTADLCRRAGVSAPVLNRLFRETRGMTGMQRLTELRVEHARVLLRSTSYPLKQIATLCGFSSQQYFCTVFRTRENLSPRAYREKHSV